MNHWKCTCAVGRLRPLSSNWLWIIQLVSEISGNSCMLLIDMLLVFPFFVFKNLQTLFVFLDGVIVERACRWGRAPVWKGRCGWEVGNTPEELGTLHPPLKIQPHVHRDKGSLSAWRYWVPIMKRPKSVVLQTRPGSAEDTRGVKGRVGERRVEEHWAATARRERPAVTQYTLLLVPVCKWTRPTVTAGPHINQPLAVRQQVGLVCLDTEPTAQLQPA